MSRPEATPITQTPVAYGNIAKIGDRVKHMGDHSTDGATATIIGFRATTPEEGFRNTERPGNPWIKVIIRPDNPTEDYGRKPDGTWEWDWDRTQLRNPS